ncbi:23S rRNA pseudouridine(1911/1915/1917) synthase RluD [Nitrosococcus oceani]|uniref:23S rRNA pseudouridine(1911/1915/1917) synthase RluD n=1 Tax=Nitrosococcus oceani TaxID=1229 RepID=UPI0004E961D9|nr:23S rRNA pseudouridine(1911/1915/1917) synthase RluD [Nitrosococcus oceani]KFI21753.1 ribosomal large subunit pseudouridine synthase D [Nitrosococcus oceani]
MRETIELSITLPSELAGKRLDQALAQVFPAYSRSRLQQWIKHGQVKVNDAPARPRDTVQGGEWIVVMAEAEAEVIWKSQPLPLEIRYEDEAIIVVNKPAGLVVHPAAGNRDGTLVNALLHHAPELEGIPRAGIVHRLDKDTSGLLVVARNLVAHHGLVRQLQARQITREYQAIAVGVMTGGGRIEAPIQRHPVHRKRMAVISTGKPALTHYRVLNRFRVHTHVSCRLETGRTHQIRVHLAHIGYPLLGDPTYGKRLHIPRESSEELSTALRHFKRQALHAARLGLVHPEKKQEMRWESPLPEDMATLLVLLEQDRQRHI